MSRRRLKWMLCIAAAMVLVFVVIPNALQLIASGRFFRHRIIEELQAPMAVTGWSRDGLRLADGRVIQLPGFSCLPETSAALTEATKHGVELDELGRVYALVRVHHYCGNDPVSEHVARVDLADVLMYLGEGDSVVPPDKLQLVASDKPLAMFGKWGWHPGQFYAFQRLTE